MIAQHDLTPGKVTSLSVSEVDAEPLPAEPLPKLTATFSYGGTKVEITATSKYHKVCVTDSKGATQPITSNETTGSGSF